MLREEQGAPKDKKSAGTDRCRDCMSVLAGTRLSHPYLVLAKRSGNGGDNTYYCLICSAALRNNPNHLGCGWALSLIEDPA